MTPAHGFKFVSVHYVDNVRNVKTIRGGMYTAYPTSKHAQLLFTQILFILLCNFYQFYIINVCFIVLIVTVVFCMLINKHII